MRPGPAMKIQIIVLAIVLFTSSRTSAQTKALDRLELLKTFHSEFIEVSPGQGKFPKHPTLKKPFRIARYEVPQNLWLAVMGSNPSRWCGERNSVERLSFDEARSFCARATELMRQAKLIGDREVVRLPYEDEWEYAASAGTTTAYSFGDDVDQLNKYAWSTRNAAGNDPAVGALLPNPWGLYDVHGYLWEWCVPSKLRATANKDDDSQEHSEGHDHESDEKQNAAVLRGGSWKDPAEKLKTKFRAVVPKDSRDDAIGLRCVLSGL